MRRLTGRVSIVALALAGVLLANAAVAAAALPRATSDRPDDAPGPKMHVVYAVPSDQADASLDADGTVEASVGAMQAYLRSQTAGPALELDTAGGALDVTFVGLPRTEAEYAAQQDVAQGIADDLRRAGLTDRSKVYGVFYEGSAPGPAESFALCGEGGRSGGLALAVVILHNRCGYDLAGSRAGVPGAVEFVLLHEALHAMGFVPRCAAHATSDGHVADNPQDLMSAFLPSGTPILDVNHDDYFQAGRSDCLDVTLSRFLEGAGTTITVAVGGAGHGRVRGEAAAPDIGDYDCPPACSATFDAGRAVTVALSADADPGYVLARWEGACTGRAQTCELVVSASTSATAVFARAPVVLNVLVRGRGRVVSTPAGISCSRRCGGEFAFGSKVRLRARPSAGWRFTGWTGACNGRVPCFVRMSRAASVRATFVRRR
jgi:hypothetical protein